MAYSRRSCFFHENLRQAAKRVAKEELGFNIELVKEIGVLEYSTREEMFGKPLGIAFLAKIISGELELDEQSTEIGFFKNLPENMIIDEKRFIEEKLDEIEEI
jgi:ADP-ribose pyrophosphatase YjhB (NUDIX family)